MKVIFAFDKTPSRARAGRGAAAVVSRGALGALAALACAGVLAACSSSSPSSDPPAGAPAGATVRPAGDTFDVPVDGASHAQVAEFNDGDALFDLTLREFDGLGPLYTRASCGACHTDATRGPGAVEKMSVVEADGITASEDQSKLPFGNTVHPLLAAGATTPILPPEGDPSIKVTLRVGPPVLGRGYMEAILDSEIERVAAEQAARPDAIHGRVNHVIYASEHNPDTRFHDHHKGDTVIGRFGLKARVATLDDFTADALQGDMGITSPLRPTEIANPDGLTDDRKPGTDVTIDSVNKRAMYLRMIAIPRRPALEGQGADLFAQAKCAACHVPSMATRPDYPIAQLAGIQAFVFTDMLLHDLGDALADGTRGIDGEAGSRDWRTAPLIGLRFNRTFMHDGRALSIRDAIEDHASSGSEANESVDLFHAMDPAQQQALLEFVGAL
jgi:CxxC motif-containing protein (DUF1111 family)